LRYYGWSGVRKAQEVRAKSVQVFREITNHPRLGGVLLFYYNAITFEVMLAVYPAYMRKASLTTEDIEMIFLFFVHRDLLLFFTLGKGI
jgi:hypothetical protein